MRIPVCVCSNVEAVPSYSIHESRQSWICTNCQTVSPGELVNRNEGVVKQRIQSSHMPPCHRHMVIATNLNSLFDLLLCSTPQTRAKCCLELTAVSGYRMFLGPFG